MNFNPVFINATTLDDCYFQLLSELYHKGRKYLITEGSYKGAYRLAFDDVAGFIKYPHQRPLAPIMPEGIPAPTNDEDIEKYFIEYLMDGNIKDNEDYKYGTWIVGGRYHSPKLKCVRKNEDYILYMDYIWDKPVDILVPNQLEWVINHFKEKGFGNEHCAITIGYPESNFAYDLPYTNEQERKTSPCLRLLDFRIISETKYKCTEMFCEWESNIEEPFCPHCHQTKIKKFDFSYLLTKVVYRSWDLWGGFPVNMGGFVLLSEFISNELGVEPGPLSFTSKSLHAYDFQLEVLKQRLGK